MQCKWLFAHPNATLPRIYSNVYSYRLNDEIVIYTHANEFGSFFFFLLTNCIAAIQPINGKKLKRKNSVQIFNICMLFEELFRMLSFNDNRLNVINSKTKAKHHRNNSSNQNKTIRTTNQLKKKQQQQKKKR